MSSIFLLYEGQALPIRYRPNARARGLKLTCSLGGDLLLTAPPGTPQQALYRFLEANRDRIGRQVMAARRRAEALPQPEEDVFIWLGEPLPVARRVPCDRRRAPHVQPLWLLPAQRPPPLPEQLPNPHAPGGYPCRHRS